MFWIIGVGCLLILAFIICKPIKNQYGTFGDDNYDYEQEARDRGWIE